MKLGKFIIVIYYFKNLLFYKCNLNIIYVIRIKVNVKISPASLKFLLATVEKRI